jgi:hydrogenase/urease accessory protein HupE
MPQPDGRRRAISRLWPVLGLMAGFAPAAAEAHTGLQGVGSFWSGVAHLLTSLDQLGFLLGLAIWTGFHDRRFDARVVAAAFAAVFAGVFIGAAFAGVRPELGATLAGLMAAVGLCGAARLRLGGAPLLAVAAAGGVVVGAAGAEAATGLTLVLFALGGAVAGASVLSYGLLAARRLEAEWGRIAMRAGASWIAAIGVMVLALSFAPHPGRL